MKLEKNSDILTANRVDGLQFRRMQLRDVDDVFELEEQIFSDPWAKGSFVYEIVSNMFSFPYVIDRDGQIIGYAIYWCIRNEASLTNFAVDAGYRRIKIGSEFLNHLIEEMKQKDVEVVYLEVRKSNLPAQQLYQNHGFEVIGVRKNYYTKQKEDAVIMKLFLKEGWIE